jgi:hypothetical protein
MNDEMAAMLQEMRDQLAVQHRAMITADAATARLLANGRAALEQGRQLVAWFKRAEQEGRTPAPCPSAPGA